MSQRPYAANLRYIYLNTPHSPVQNSPYIPNFGTCAFLEWNHIPSRCEIVSEKIRYFINPIDDEEQTLCQAPRAQRQGRKNRRVQVRKVGGIINRVDTVFDNQAKLKGVVITINGTESHNEMKTSLVELMESLEKVEILMF